MCCLLTYASLHNTHTQRKLVCWFASDCLLVWRTIDGIPRAYSTIRICKRARNCLRKHHLRVVSAANQRIQTYCNLIGSSKDINTYMTLFSTYLYTMFVKLDKAVSKAHAIKQYSTIRAATLFNSPNFVKIQGNSHKKFLFCIENHCSQHFVMWFIDCAMQNCHQIIWHIQWTLSSILSWNTVILFLQVTHYK